MSDAALVILISIMFFSLLLMPVLLLMHERKGVRRVKMFGLHRLGSHDDALRSWGYALEVRWGKRSAYLTVGAHSKRAE